MKKALLLAMIFTYLGCSTGTRPPVTSSNQTYGCACGGAASSANLYCCQPSDAGQPVYINFTGQGCSAGATATDMSICKLNCTEACKQYNP